MKILVTGGAGFIGSRLVQRLVTAGHEVVVADNLTATRSLALLEHAAGAVEFVHLDVRCQEDFDRLPRGPYDRIFHLAASFANGLSVEHPTLDARTNIEGTINVVRFARERGCRLLVYTGSSSSYGDAPLPLAEDAAMRPATPYAISKLAAEWQVRASGVPFAVFRLFNVYGPGDPPGEYRNAIPNMMKAATSGRPIEIFGEDATRDFTFVEDVVDYLSDPEPARGQAVNVATGAEIRIVVVAAMILERFDLPRDRLRILPRRSWDRVVRRVADVTRLAEIYGRTPSTPFGDGMARAAEWLNDAGHLPRRPS